MPVSGPGPYQLRILSARLREMGTDGQGLRRELFGAITEAARPLAAEVKDPGHLRAYVPNRYADVLASDLAVTTTKSTSRSPGIAIRAKGRRHKRKVVRLDEGILSHPLFGDRLHWYEQRSHVRGGFWSDPVEKHAPDIRRRVADAMHEVTRKITSL